MTTPAPMPPDRLTDGELKRERADLEHKLGDDSLFMSPEQRERWIGRLWAIKQEIQERVEIRRSA